MTKDKILNNNLKKMGFSSLSLVQKESIPALRRGENVLVLSETGSGKTAAYLIPVFEKKIPQTLIITPTRELARQVQEMSEQMANGLDFSVHRFHGQENAHKQIQSLKNSQSQHKILVATPGRILDLLENKDLSLDDCEYVVLDEVDELLERGFLDDLQRIYRYIPRGIQKSAYSATQGQAIHTLLKEFFINYKTIYLLEKQTKIERLSMDNILCESKEKYISDFILSHVYDSFLVFVSSRERAHQLNRYLEKQKIQTVPLHGDMSQRKRNQSISAFKNYEAQVLVATDLASRGLDLPEIDFVVNFDLPGMKDVFEHRIGRTARFDKKGHVLNLYYSKEKNHLNFLVKGFGKNAL